MKERRPPHRKTDADMRNSGIVLINNALKARSMAEPLLDLVLSDTGTIADRNWSCYMLQQSIELSVKGLIAYYYSEYREGHFLRFNADILVELCNVYDELREIEDRITELQGGVSVMLVKWEAISRYNELKVKKRDIEYAVELADDIMSFIKRHRLNEYE